MKKIFLFILPLFISVGVSQDVIYTTTLYNDENFTGKNSRVESITYYKKTRNGLVKFRYEEYYKLTGNLFIKGALKDGEKDGKWIWYNENGQINSEGNYKVGKRFGKYTFYYENKNGQKKLEETYKDGIKDGKSILWDESGQKRSQGIYINGNENGLWIGWYGNGQKEYEETYKDGIKDGKSILWDENGQKRSEETYKEGKLISDKWWDENGNLMK